MYSGSMPDGISSAGLMPPPNRLTVTPREESRSRLTPIMPITSMLDITSPLCRLGSVFIPPLFQRNQGAFWSRSRTFLE